MSEENIKDLTVGEISNYIATMNKLVEEGIIKFNKEKAYAEICIDEATTYLEKQNVQLQQENNQLKEKINTYENPEDLTLMFMYCDEKAKDKIKQLEEVIEEVRDRITIKLGRYINEKDYVIDDVALDELLQILDKVKGE